MAIQRRLVFRRRRGGVFRRVRERRQRGIHMPPERVRAGRFRHAAGEAGGVIEAGKPGQRLFARRGAGGLQRIVEHRLDRGETLHGGGVVLRPSDQQALREVLEVGAVVAVHGKVWIQAEQRPRRLIRARPPRLGDHGLRAQHVADAAQVQPVRHVFPAARLAQHGGLAQQRQIVRLHVERARVVAHRLGPVAGFAQQIRLGAVDVDEPGDVVDAVESDFRAGEIAAFQQHFAEIDVHLRRQRLAQRDQSPSVRELPLAVAAAGVEAAEAGVRRCQRHQLPQDGGSAQSGLGERVLKRQKLALGVARLLRDVGEQLV